MDTDLGAEILQEEAEIAEQPSPGYGSPRQEMVLRELRQ
jgi:hypothetical protein